MISVKTHTGFLRKIIRAKWIKIATESYTIFKNHHKLFDCKLIAKNNDKTNRREILLKLDELALAYEIN